MSKKNEMSKSVYKDELARLRLELIKLQGWVKAENLKVIVIFEGRDAAGKSGTIKRITKKLNSRVCKVVALPIPNQRETAQWYFQRFVTQFPAEGEILLFDRSWYNRAGVEKVMGFCSDDQYERFLRDCPTFEKLLIDSGIILIKYWFSITQSEQEKRLRARNDETTKRWKLGSIDITARDKWDEYSMAQDKMFESTDTEFSPWHIVEASIKRHARINCISHLLSMFDYQDLTPKKKYLTKLPNLSDSRITYENGKFVPDIAASLAKDE